MGHPYTRGTLELGNQADLPGKEPAEDPTPPPRTQSQHKEGQAGDPGNSRGRLQVWGRRLVRPAQGGRQERGPERPARLGSSPQEQARAGVAATLSRLITYTYSF